MTRPSSPGSRNILGLATIVGCLNPTCQSAACCLGCVGRAEMQTLLDVRRGQRENHPSNLHLNHE
jgi:hypothetical protein